MYNAVHVRAANSKKLGCFADHELEIELEKNSFFELELVLK